MEKGKKESHSSAQNSKYDYTKNLNVQDNQKSYEKSVDERRGISNDKPKEKTDDGVNTSEYKKDNSFSKNIDNQTPFSGNENYGGSNPYKHHENNQSHLNNSYTGQGNYSQNDYTKNIHVQDAQKDYEKGVENKRGIPENQSFKSTSTNMNISRSTNYSKNIDEKSNHELNNNSSGRNIINDKSENDNNSKSDYKHYDYTKNIHVQDAQKDYDKFVDQKRGIPVDIGESYLSSTVKTDMPSRSSGNYDYTKNTMIQGAQKEYEDKINKIRGYNPNGTNISLKDERPKYVSPINERRGVTYGILDSQIYRKELYQNSARGNARNTPFVDEFGLSQEDIQNLLKTRDIKYSRGVKYKIANHTSQGIGTVGHYLYNVSSSGADAGQGVRQFTEIASPVAFIITDAVMMSAHKSLQTGMAERLNKIAAVNRVFGDSNEYLVKGRFRTRTEVEAVHEFIKNPEIGLSKVDIQELKEELIRKLRPTGLNKLDLRDPYVATHQLKAFLRKNKGKLTKSEIGAVKMLMELNRPDIIGKSIPRKRSRFSSGIRMKLFRYAQQDNSGAGFVLVYTFYKRAYQTLLFGQKALRSVKNAVKIAGKLALLGAKKVAVMAARTKKGQALLNTDTGKKISTKTREAKQKHDLKKEKKNVKRNARQKRKNAFRERLRDPLGIKRNKAKILNKLKKTKVGKAVDKILSPYKLLKRALARILTGVMTVISTIISVIMVAIAICMVACVIIITVFSAIMFFVSLFDLSTSREKVIKDNLVYIQELSEKQNRELENLNTRYDNVTVTYEDVKNEEAYNSKNHKTARPVIETTNSAEMISMAQVYFNFNLEKQPKKDVKKYIKKLYNGSHLITITTNERTYIDGNGKEQKLVDANVVFKTYYFDDLFNCKLMDGNGVGVIAGTEITDKVWNYLRTAGIPPIQVAGIMGNMYAESGFDPGIVEHGNGIGFGLCQWSYGRRTALENFAASQGKNPADLQVQLDYFMTEYNPGCFNSYYTGLDNYTMFVNATSVNDATYYFMWGWERPAEWAGNSTIEKRQTAAQTYYDNYIDKELITDSDDSE